MPSSDAYLSATTSGGTSPGDPPSSQWVRVGDGRACGAAAGPRVAVLTRLLRLGRPWEVAGRGSGQQGQPAPLSGATSRDPVFHLWRGGGTPLHQRPHALGRTTSAQGCSWPWRLDGCRVWGLLGLPRTATGRGTCMANGSPRRAWAPSDQEPPGVSVSSGHHSRMPQMGGLRNRPASLTVVEAAVWDQKSGTSVRADSAHGRGPFVACTWLPSPTSSRGREPASSHPCLFEAPALWVGVHCVAC